MIITALEKETKENLKNFIEGISRYLSEKRIKEIIPKMYFPYPTGNIGHQYATVHTEEGYTLNLLITTICNDNELKEYSKFNKTQIREHVTKCLEEL